MVIVLTRFGTIGAKLLWDTYVASRVGCTGQVTKRCIHLWRISTRVSVYPFGPPPTDDDSKLRALGLADMLICTELVSQGIWQTLFSLSVQLDCSSWPLGTCHRLVETTSTCQRFLSKKGALACGGVARGIGRAIFIA